MTITADDLRGMIAAISRALNDHQSELNQLDAALGDGDHGTGISVGFAAAVDQVQGAESPADVLKHASAALMNRMGGSSGALFGTLFLRAALRVKDQAALSPGQFAAMFQAGTEGVMQRGKAQTGDKTMLDALSPAAAALKQSVDDGESFLAALAAAARAARSGADSTAHMQARHGRARYVGERAVGHMDAGAQSVALMFAAVHHYWEGKHHGET